MICSGNLDDGGDDDDDDNDNFGDVDQDFFGKFLRKRIHTSQCKLSSIFSTVKMYISVAYLVMKCCQQIFWKDMPIEPLQAFQLPIHLL